MNTAQMFENAVRTNRVRWMFARQDREQAPQAVVFGLTIPSSDPGCSDLLALRRFDPERYMDMLSDIADMCMDYVSGECGYCMTGVRTTSAVDRNGSLVFEMKGSLDLAA